MMKRKAQFSGNVFLTKLTPLIYFASKFLFKAKNKIKSFQKKPSSILYVYREWGQGTIVIESTKDTLDSYLQGGGLDFLCLKTMDPIVELVKRKLQDNSYSHLVIDVRAMVTSAFWYQIPGLLIACRSLANLCYENSIEVICQSTDFFNPSDRVISAILTSNNGLVVSLACIPELSFFPHKRVLGPAPVTVPRALLPHGSLPAVRDIPVFFGGSLYEPRKTFFDNLCNELESRNIKYGYQAKSEITNYADYLKVLEQAKIVVLTTVFSKDRHRRQMQAKTIEATAMGALLIVQQCESVDAFYDKNIDYVPFDSLEDVPHVADLIEKYLGDDELRVKIALCAQRKSIAYSTSGGIWPAIDSKLRSLGCRTLND